MLGEFHDIVTVHIHQHPPFPQPLSGLWIREKCTENGVKTFDLQRNTRVGVAQQVADAWQCSVDGIQMVKMQTYAMQARSFALARANQACHFLEWYCNKAYGDMFDHSLIESQKALEVRITVPETLLSDDHQKVVHRNLRRTETLCIDGRTTVANLYFAIADWDATIQNCSECVMPSDPFGCRYPQPAKLGHRLEVAA